MRKAILLLFLLFPVFLMAADQLCLVAVRADHSEKAFSLSNIQYIEVVSDGTASMVVRAKNGTVLANEITKVLFSVADPSDVKNIKALAADELFLYPNPVKEQLTLLCSGGSDVPVQIFDLHGTIVYSQLFDKNAKEITLHLSSLSEGIYFVNYGNRSIKFIKQ